MKVYAVICVTRYEACDDEYGLPKADMDHLKPFLSRDKAVQFIKNYLAENWIYKKEIDDFLKEHSEQVEKYMRKRYAEYISKHDSFEKPISYEEYTAEDYYDLCSDAYEQLSGKSLDYVYMIEDAPTEDEDVVRTVNISDWYGGTVEKTSRFYIKEEEVEE